MEVTAKINYYYFYTNYQIYSENGKFCTDATKSSRPDQELFAATGH